MSSDSLVLCAIPSGLGPCLGASLMIDVGQHSGLLRNLNFGGGDLVWADLMAFHSRCLRASLNDWNETSLLR